VELLLKHSEELGSVLFGTSNQMFNQHKSVTFQVV